MRKGWTRTACLATLLAVGVATGSNAAILINEVFTNPPGTDNTQEFFELKSSTGGVEAMTGLTLLIVEGEGTAGVIDVALPLNAFSTGTNGLFYWRANAAVGSFTPAPSPDSTVNTVDFAPDLENGAQTYILVSGFTGAIGNDLDPDNDGDFDGVLPWSSVVDAIGVRDSDGGEFAYGASLGFSNFPQLPSGFEIETLARRSDNNQWMGSDIGGTNPGGPYTFDPLETIYTDGTVVPVALLDFDDVSPGSVNPKLVPEPSTGVIFTLGAVGLGFFALRRRTS